MNTRQEISYTLHISGLSNKDLVHTTVYNSSDHTLDGMRRFELSMELLLDRIAEMERQIEDLTQKLRER